MTKKPDGFEFLKVALPAKMSRDLDDALKLHGLHRARSWLMVEFTEAFIQETKEMLAAGKLPHKE